jgi:hypothetical protein
MTCSLSDDQLVVLSPLLETADHHPVVLDKYMQAALAFVQMIGSVFGFATSHRRQQHQNQDESRH